MGITRLYSAPTRGAVQKARLGANIPRFSSSTRLRQLSPSSSTSYKSNQPLPKVENVAVIGGGLTGLTTAFRLTQEDPNLKVTLYEASDRLGGWVDTLQTPVADSSYPGQPNLQLERGPRTVLTQETKAKWDDLFLYDLIHQVGIRHEVYRVPKRDSLKRYIYYPDHLVNVAPPHVPRGSPVRFSDIRGWIGFIRNVLTEPLFTGWYDALRHRLKETRSPPSHPKQTYDPPDGDISIGKFFQRYLGGRRDLVDNLFSGMIHGIYGGDVWKLSMRSGMFSATWFSTAVKGLTPREVATKVNPKVYVPEEDMYAVRYYETQPEAKNVRDMNREMALGGYIGFHSGFSALTDALVRKLGGNRNVTIKTGKPVLSISMAGTSQVSIRTDMDKPNAQYDKVISTIFAKTLAQITNGALPTLAKSRAVTIQLINLWSPMPNLTKPNDGFGYLIPQSVPFANNPECVLGVLFDTDREAKYTKRSTADLEGTTLTVMMGGHFWDSYPEDMRPTEDEAIEMAKTAVARHMGIPAELFTQASTKLCRDCIPQHRVGHFEDMRAAAHELEKAFSRRLLVAGPSYTPPGVLTSIRAGFDAAAQVVGKYRTEVSHMSRRRDVGDTGLARFTTLGSILDDTVALDQRHLPLRKHEGLEPEGWSEEVDGKDAAERARLRDGDGQK